MSTICLLLSSWIAAAQIFVHSLGDVATPLKIQFTAERGIADTDLSVGAPVSLLGTRCGVVTGIAPIASNGKDGSSAGEIVSISVSSRCRALLRSGTIAVPARSKPMTRNPITRNPITHNPITHNPPITHATDELGIELFIPVARIKEDRFRRLDDNATIRGFGSYASYWGRGI
jgi:hypothetical protein